MLVLTPVSVPRSGLYNQPFVPSIAPRYNVDAVLRQAAYDYAVAHARAEAARSEAARRRQAQERMRRQALFDLYLEEAMFVTRRAWPESTERPYTNCTSSHRDEAYARVVSSARAQHYLTHRRHETGNCPFHTYIGHGVSQRAEQPSYRPYYISRHGRHATVPQPMSSRVAVHPTALPERRYPVSDGLQERLQDRLRSESDQEMGEALQSLLSHFTPAAPSASPASPAFAELKGKGKARETIQSTPSSASAAQEVPTETPTNLQELIAQFYTALHEATDTSAHETSTRIPVKDFTDIKGKGEQKDVIPEVEATSTSAPQNENVETPDTEAPSPSPGPFLSTGDVNLHRTPALPPSIAAKLLDLYKAKRSRKLSLAEIGAVQATLRALETSFVFPEKLDFTQLSPADSNSESTKDFGSTNGLAYTANNSPIHTYEHSLNVLLTRLDAVESRGDLHVRGRRKEIVKEVERALREMERKVEESHERDAAKDTVLETKPEVGTATTDTKEVNEEVEEITRPEGTAETEVFPTSHVKIEAPLLEAASSSSCAPVSLSENISNEDRLDLKSTLSSPAAVVSGNINNEDHGTAVTAGAAMELREPESATSHDEIPSKSSSSQEAVEASLPEAQMYAQPATPDILEVVAATSPQSLDDIVVDASATVSPSAIAAKSQLSEDAAEDKLISQPSSESEAPVTEAHPPEDDVSISAAPTSDTVSWLDSDSKPTMVNELAQPTLESPSSQPDIQLLTNEIADADVGAEALPSEGYSSEGDAFLLQSSSPPSPPHVPRNSESDEELEVIQHHDAKGADDESADEWSEVEGDGP
ncbi:hypothetical protein SCP_1001900 [Sparassis crispa]|uniref:Uncharacterized protein n=1 Tax=Sparassis crispa TaxID=139825 RepID=A0A401GXI7_9APHY|nr:hypothetical protein SCP_1001900 [Sparassis crispa]GBE86946.1 hypothetical protein SCP_1001900 [Sparassis crispa]